MSLSISKRLRMYGKCMMYIHAAYSVSYWTVKHLPVRNGIKWRRNGVQDSLSPHKLFYMRLLQYLFDPHTAIHREGWLKFVDRKHFRGFQKTLLEVGLCNRFFFFTSSERKFCAFNGFNRHLSFIKSNVYWIGPYIWSTTAENN